MTAKTSALLITLLLALNWCQTQTVEFSDDFESGLSGWDLEAPWGVTSNYAYSPGNSFTDSPAGNYASNADVIATVDQVFDFSEVGDVIVSFYLILDIENVYDWFYLEASHNGGATWQVVQAFNGEDLTEWQYHSYSLFNYVGDDEVMVRLHLIADGVAQKDGIYVDDFAITSYDTDVSGPVITHTPLYLFEAGMGATELSAKIQDATGVTTELAYSVDGGPYQFVDGEDAPGDYFDYTIPSQDPGTWVEYYVIATDEVTPSNTTESEIYSYLPGFHVVQDNGSNDAVLSIGDDAPSGTKKCAVKFTFEDPENLLGAVIHMTTLFDTDPEPVMIHVWSNEGGLPGDDIITPFMVTPECTNSDPLKGTRVDFRPYADQFTGITGDYFIGYTAPEGSALIIYSDDFFTFTVAEESYWYTGGVWQYFPGIDFHIRAITTGNLQPPVADFEFETDDAMITFEDNTENYPTTWLWEFGDGATSSVQNPVHTYETGTYTVCLTATNIMGSDSTCKMIDAAVGITDDVAGMAFSVFPNPTSDILYITCSGIVNLNGDETITVSDITGRQLFVSKMYGDKTMLDISKLPSGIYRITAASEKGGLMTQSFVKR